MGKRVYMTVLSTPDQKGWNDHVEVWDGDKWLWTGRGSISPSPVDYPDYWAVQEAGLNPNRDDYTWDKRGGIIDYGTYKFKTDDFRGGSLAINDGGYVPSQKPNPRHENKPIMNELYAHIGAFAGHPEADRGSIGCPTIHPDDIERVPKKLRFQKWRNRRIYCHPADRKPCPGHG